MNAAFSLKDFDAILAEVEKALPLIRQLIIMFSNDTPPPTAQVAALHGSMQAINWQGLASKIIPIIIQILQGLGGK